MRMGCFGRSNDCPTSLGALQRSYLVSLGFTERTDITVSDRLA
jgi:hypothetical protein